MSALIARLTSLFGLLALLLAAIGLYGVTSYTVVRRTPEIGIRMALGAARSRVVGTVIRGAVLQAVAGLAIGVLVLTATIAGIIPARRAASIDPARALRIE